MALDFSTYDYLEQSRSESPVGATFAYERSRISVPYYVDAADLDDRIEEILGSVERNRDGKLRRVLPKAHPRYNGMFATSISRVQGLGRGGLEEVTDPDVEAPRLLNAYYDYDAYLLTVEFETLPYTLLRDESVTVTTGASYYSETDTVTPSTVTICNEYERFVDVEFVPSYEVLSAQTGQMKFRTSSGDPGGFQFAGFPSMTLPKGNLKLRWLRVVESYLASPNSYLRSFAGRINQTQFSVNGYVFPAGSLLYLGCMPRRYTPPIPKELASSGIIDWEKVLDLELNFLYVERPATSPPTPTYPNRIAAQGHNCLPALSYDQKFYYVSRDAALEVNQWPLFASRRFEQLFTDPDI